MTVSYTHLFFADYVAYIMHMGMACYHTVKTGVSKYLSGGFVIALHKMCIRDRVFRLFKANLI